MEKIAHNNKSLEFLPTVMNLLMTNKLEGIKVSANEVGLFTNRTVGEMLFDGFHIDLFQQMRDAANRSGIDIPVKSPLVNDTFGLFYLVRLLFNRSIIYYYNYLSLLEK